MVNYCCVYGCGRNSKTSKHLYYYSLPKERNRLLQWLEAIGREDLLEKDPKKLTHRVCSRHFSPSDIITKHLCADAVPSLCLSNNMSEGSIDSEKQQLEHSDIVCNSCKKPILGFRYVCITCPDYDLCSRCEMLEVHDQHYLLRIPKPVNFSVANSLIKKWRQLVKDQERKAKRNFDDDSSSDDDVPITKYVRQYDSGIELNEDEKSRIRDEVTRVLNIKHPDKKEELEIEKTKKRMRLQKKRIAQSRKKAGLTIDMSISSEDLGDLESNAPEVAFADVNDIKCQCLQNIDVKDELPSTLTHIARELVATVGSRRSSSAGDLDGLTPQHLKDLTGPSAGEAGTESEQQMVQNMKLNDELSEFLIGVKYP